MYKNVEKDESKWNRNVYRKAPTLITPDFHGNSTPSCVDNRHYRQIVRSQVRPFQQEEVLPAPIGTIGKLSSHDDSKSTSTIGNHRKVISLPLASLTEVEKRHHAQTTYEMCQRLADCWNCPLDKNVTPDSIYWMYTYYSWQCPKTGVHHSWQRPLSIEFIQPAWMQGRIAIQNMKPVYNGNLPGAFSWTRSNRKLDLPMAAA